MNKTTVYANYIIHFMPPSHACTHDYMYMIIICKRARAWSDILLIYMQIGWISHEYDKEIFENEWKEIQCKVNSEINHFFYVDDRGNFVIQQPAPIFPTHKPILLAHTIHLPNKLACNMQIHFMEIYSYIFIIEYISYTWYIHM